VRRLIAIAWSPLLLAGCSNPFLANYHGARCPQVPSAHVATDPPQNATLIGTSDFKTEAALGDMEAIGAARAVGANIVQWDRAFLRDEVVLSRDAALAGGMDDASVTGAAPPPGTGTWYRFHARFWRSDSLGSIPDSTAPTAPTATNATAEAPTEPSSTAAAAETPTEPAP